MNDFSRSLEMASAGMRAQASRLRVVSENMANTDTPGYRRKLISFEESFNTGTSEQIPGRAQTQLDQSDLTQIYDPSHPLADEAGYFEGSNVNLMIEIADAREAQRSYDANVKMFEQTRKMSMALMDLLRR